MSENIRRLVAFDGDLHREQPTTGPEDLTIVKDVSTGKIVSTLCILSQIWSYDGIKVGVGWPE